MGVGERTAPGMGGELVVVASTGSTNDDVAELGRAGAPQGSAVAAHGQLAGRGRRGHEWGSPSSGLYESVLLRPAVPMGYLMGLSAVCAMGIQDALWELGATKAELKWPNDVVVGARKLAGILVEAGTGAAGVYAVCGVGVNLEMPELDGPMGSVNPLAPAAMADAMADGRPAPGFDELARAIRAHVVERCDAWARDVAQGRSLAGPLACVLDEYFDRLPLLGKPVRAVTPAGSVICTGTFVAVDVWGRVTVRRGDGVEVVLASEQASLRPIGALSRP